MLRTVQRVMGVCFAASVLSCSGPERPVVSLDNSRALPWHEIETSGPVEYGAEMEWRDGELYALLMVENSNTSPVEVRYGTCSIGVRAYESAELWEPADWDNHLSEAVYCYDVGLVLAVEQGGVGEIEERVDTSQIPAGEWHFALVIEVEGERRRIEAGIAEVP